MKIMVMTPYLPHEGVGHGGGTAVRDLVTWLAQCHEVMLAALVRPGEEGYCDDVRRLGAKVEPLPFLDNGARGRQRLDLIGNRFLAWTRSLHSGYPWFVEKYWSPELSRRVISLAADFEPDAIQVEYLQLALLMRDLKTWRDTRAAGKPRLVLNTHELGSLPRERRAARAGNPLAAGLARREAAAWRRLQVDACDWADRVLCVTPEDHDRFRAMGGRHLVTVPLGMDLDRITVDWDPGPGHRFLFVGSFDHRPNRLAAGFLLDTVWPRVAAELPESRLVLAGRGSREFLEGNRDKANRNTPGVTAAGFVDDLTPLFRESHLFLAPLPEGGGIKIKILEAMARGIPVVTSPVGAEGITSAQDDAVVIAPCDQGFALAVLAAVADQDKARSRAIRARKIIEEKFSWQAITRRLVEIYTGP